MSGSCIHCAADLEPRASFCPECGTRQGRVCEECGAPIEEGATFCGECGSKVSAKPATTEGGSSHVDRSQGVVEAKHVARKHGAAQSKQIVPSRHVVQASDKQSPPVRRSLPLDTSNEEDAQSLDAEIADVPFGLNPYFLRAVDIVKESGNASASFLQQQLQIAPARAELYLTKLQEWNIVSSQNADGTREVYSDPEPDQQDEREEDRWIGPDPLYDQAVEVVIKTNRASISSLQRHFRIPYNRAERLVETMEAEGIVSPSQPDGSRQVKARVVNGVLIAGKPSPPKTGTDIGGALGGVLGRLFGK